MNGKDLVCPECGFDAKLIDTAEIYNGRSFGKAWACQNFPTCDTYVGCHKGGTQPKGTLAGKVLRGKRQQAHHYFDHLWKTRPRIMDRKHAYKKMAEHFAVSVIHIGESNGDTCDRIVAWAREKIQDRLKGAAS